MFHSDTLYVEMKCHVPIVCGITARLDVRCMTDDGRTGMTTPHPSSSLSEELVLLRGRDDSQGPVAASPVYNRLFWNFTTGDGEVAYALSYNIFDVNFDGLIDDADARIQFPQAHGDAQTN